MTAICEKSNMENPGAGICFSLPVSQVYGIKRVADQKQEQIRKAKALAKDTTK